MDDLSPFLPPNPFCPGNTDPCKHPLLQSKNHAYVGPNLSCSGIKNCDDLSTVIQKLDQKICKEVGTSIVWMGSLDAAPEDPNTNWAYYNTIDGKSYIYNGASWEMFSQDGETAYESYLEYTTDNPPLTEQQWSEGESLRVAAEQQRAVWQPYNNATAYKIGLALKNNTLWKQN